MRDRRFCFRLSLAELIGQMAEITIHSLQEKKFGKKRVSVVGAKSTPTSEKQRVKDSRQASRADRYKAWKRAGGKCEKCGSKRNLNWDHVKPYALGGRSEPENLRVLCHHCNQREAIKVFGLRKIENGRRSSRA